MHSRPRRGLEGKAIENDWDQRTIVDSVLELNDER
jgi:hypothetical protein